VRRHAKARSSGIPTQILNKTFAALIREVDEADYMESL